MSTASAIRLQIETALAHRIPAALTPVAKAIRPVLPTGIAAVDELLGGGLPVGAISEFAGPESSGRTSLALAFLASLTQAGRVAAWIDVENVLDPESAAAAGVDLKRLLWVRCGAGTQHQRTRKENAFRIQEKYFVPAAVKKGLHGGGFGPHPRTEINGLAGAVSELLRGESREDSQPRIQLDRAAAAQVSFSVGKGDQRAWAGKAPGRPPGRPPGKQWTHLGTRPWMRIEQALRGADLLLQAGGFAAVVLDMAGIAPEFAARVPMATWFRYRAAAERAQSCVLLLTQHSCASSSAELLLRFAPGRPYGDEATVFTGMEHGVEVERRRFTQSAVHPSAAHVVSMRKPPLPELKQRENCAHWRSRPGWAGAR